MLQLSYIRENREEILQAYKKRNLDAAAQIDKVLDLDNLRKQMQTELDQTLAESNRIAKEIGELFKSGNAAAANDLKEKTKVLKDQSQINKEELQDIEKEQLNLLYQLPNVPNKIVPSGNSEADNKIVFEHGAIKKFSFEALPHWDLAKKYGLIDFELGVKITGAGFPIYQGKGAKLQRALINFFLDEAEAAGYNEVIPPHLVNEASG